MHLHKNGWSVVPFVCLLAGLWCIAVGATPGQEKDEKKEPTKEQPFESKDPPIDKTVPIPYWETDRSYADRAALHLFASASPLSALGTRVLAAEHQPVLEGWDFVFDEVLPIYGRFLRMLQDGRELPVRDSKNPRPLTDADNAMFSAYKLAIERSHSATMDMFKKSAEKYQHVKYSHLKASPDKYRGQVITVEGNLMLIRKHDAPSYVREVKHVYTGWVVGPHKKLPPFTIVFTDLPETMRVTEKLDVPITFTGYFLAFVKFPADTPKQTEYISPYVIGKTFTVVETKQGEVKKDENEEKQSYAYHYIVGTLGAIIVIAILVASMNIFFRRGDDAVKSRLAEVREKSQPFQLEDESAPPPSPPEANPPGPAPPA